MGLFEFLSGAKGHSHDGWVPAGPTYQEDHPAADTHQRRTGCTGAICRHYGWLFARDYCESCGDRI